MFAAAATCLFVLLTCVPASAEVFTVDDDGPADFQEISEALASSLVGDGDVLLVSSGSYGGFVVSKSVSILSQKGTGWSAGSITIDGPTFFTLRGASATHITVQDVRGRGVLDDCFVQGLAVSSDYAYLYGRTKIRNCDQLLFQRSYFRGSDGCYTYGSDAGPAVEVEGSNVVFSDCVLRGGNANGFICPAHYPWSGPGLVVSDHSDVLLSGTTVSAGVPLYASAAEPAISLYNSEAIVRGNPEDNLSTYPAAETIALYGTSRAIVSGVTLVPPHLPGGVLVPTLAEPFLEVTGEGTLDIVLFGPMGASALVGLSAAVKLVPVPSVLGQLWLDPAGIFFAKSGSLLGQRRGTGFPLVLPSDPGLTGVSFVIQAWVDPISGAGPWLTNPVQVGLGG